MTLRPATLLLLCALAFAPGSRALADAARCEAAQLVLDNGSVRAVASWTGPAGRLALTTALGASGFAVELPDLYSGALFELARE